MFVFAPGNGVHPLCLDGIVYITLPYSQYEMWRQVAVRCDAVYFGPDDAYLSEQNKNNSRSSIIGLSLRVSPSTQILLVFTPTKLR